jgi:hypothetical protein
MTESTFERFEFPGSMLKLLALPIALLGGVVGCTSASDALEEPRDPVPTPRGDDDDGVEVNTNHLYRLGSAERKRD